MSAQNSLPPIPPDISMITGPTMVGIFLNWGFMGILVSQLYFYHANFQDDPPKIKLLVYGLAVLDVLQTGLVSADAFHWFVFGFGNMERLDDTFLNSWDVPMLDGIISMIAQIFYGYRIWVLRKSYLFPVLILLISLTQCGAAIATAVKAHQLGHLSLISTEVAEQTTWLVGAAVADILITAVLSWTLLKSRSKELSSSNGMIVRLVRLTVETNLLTAGVAVISLILFLGFPNHSTLVVPPTAIIGKLYTNCLVAVLNNRRGRFRNRGSSQGRSTSSGATTSNVHTFRIPDPPASARRQPQTDMKVQVFREVELDDIEMDNTRKREYGISPNRHLV